MGRRATSTGQVVIIMVGCEGGPIGNTIVDRAGRSIPRRPMRVMMYGVEAVG